MRWMAGVASVGLVLAAPAGAAASGGPVPPLQGGSGVAVAGNALRYVAHGARHATVITRTGRGSGRMLRIPGRYGIPGADFNGSTTGLSGDGRTLVLAGLGATRPSRTTQLLVLDAPRLAVRKHIALPGRWTVDAVSPDGRWLYLIHYLSSDAGRYEVRAYDLPARRVLQRPVVDPRDRGEAMTGVPIARVMSADTRWAYTLYIRPSGTPFVHALDTSARRAVCVDLPTRGNGDLGGARLVLGAAGAKLRVEVGGVPEAVIDARTFAVSPTSPE
jgi:hypothetical protein